VALIAVSGGHLDERQLYDLAYNIIEPQVERLGGVASASVDGGQVRQITVNLNRDQLYAKGLSILEVVRAVNNADFLLPTWSRRRTSRRSERRSAYCRTRSARRTIDSGRVKPSARAVLRFTTSSDRDGSSMGRSRGFVGPRILPMYAPARR
jgi:multidrug efflux pump subunit AcrB